MTGADGIDDRQSLRAWLRDQPRETALAIATRAALRVIPLFWSRVASQARRNDLAELATCRLLIVPSVAAIRTTPELKAAARAARSARAADAVARAAYAAARAAAGTRAAAYAAEAARAVAYATYAAPDAAVEAAADAAADAARAAADAAASAYAAAAASDNRDDAYASAFAAAHAAVWRTTREDCLAAEAGQAAYGRPLWAGGEAADWTSSVHAGWRDRGGAWTFWADWYEGHLTGEPLDFGLLERIALIPPADWDRGDAHLAGIVERAYDDYLAASPARRARAVPRLAPPAGAVAGAVAEVVAGAAREGAPRSPPALPQALDDLEALIQFQIERLRARPYRDEADRDESVRFLGVFATMADTVRRLRGMVADGGAPSGAGEAEVTWPARGAGPGGH
jgi:hypothetical protein